jgi:hypothetical protein
MTKRKEKTYSLVTLDQARTTSGRKTHLTLAVILSPLFTLLAIASFGVAVQLTETWWQAALWGFIPACIFMGIAALFTTRTHTDFPEVLRRFWRYNIVGYDAWLYLENFCPESDTDLLGGVRVLVTRHGEDPDEDYWKEGRIYIVIPLAGRRPQTLVKQCSMIDVDTLAISDSIGKFWKAREGRYGHESIEVSCSSSGWMHFHRSCHALKFLEEQGCIPYMPSIAWIDHKRDLAKKDIEREKAVLKAREKHIADLVQMIFLISNSSRLGARKEAKKLRESLQAKLSALLPEDDPRRVYCSGRIPTRIQEDLPA